MRSLPMFLAALVLLAACADSGGETTSPTTTSTTLLPTSADPPLAPTTTTPTTTTSAAPTEPRVPEQLAGFDLAVVTLDDAQLLVAIADTAEQRRRGLMFVEDLGDLDGMLFSFAEDSSGGFWMKNTLLPLDIAFFDVDGRFVDGFAMEPCKADPCPSYFPDGSYRYALEMEEGAMPDSPRQLQVPIRSEED